MENWDIKTSTFDKQFRLVKYPANVTTPSLTIGNITFSTNCVVKNEKMFELLGEINSENFILDNFTVS